MKNVDRDKVVRLVDLPNVGEAIGRDLVRIGVTEPGQFVGADAYEMHDRLCEVLGFVQDYCVIDVYLSAIDFMEGGEAKKWWAFTAERKRVMAGR